VARTPPGCQNLPREVALEKWGSSDRQAGAEDLTVLGQIMHDTYMATKTITIDLEAYQALKRRKGSGESFSDVIKKHFGGVTGREFHHLLDATALEDETLDRLDELVGERKGHPARAASL